MEPEEQRVLDDIEQYGCHVIHVLGEADLPPFSYSVGVGKAGGAPEVLVIGLERELSHSIVNEYADRVKRGLAPVAGHSYAGFLVGHDMRVEPVHSSHFAEYVGWNCWLYNGDDFEVVQLVYPTTEGVWPWDDSATPDFRSWQPILKTPRQGSAS